MAEVLNARKRQSVGTRHCRQLRAAGKVPAILYGHGQENVNLELEASDLQAAIRHGSKMIDIRGDFAESALIRDVQWDALGLEVLHVDLTRVSAEEAVEVTIPVELRGEAPGTKEGGVIDHSLHEIEIRCPAGAIPDKIEVNINSLHLNQEITAGELALPAGATLLTEAEAVVVGCNELAPELEEEAVSGEAAEPEVIGRKAEAEDEDSD